MANSKEGNRHIRRTAGVTGAVLAGAELMSALTGGSAAVAKVDNRPTAIVIKGEMPSLNSSILVFPGKEAAAARPTAIESQYIQPIEIESAEQAAELFGIKEGPDTYASNPDNWFINEYGGATLKPDPSGKVHRVRTNGAVAEGWIKIKKKGIDAQILVADPTHVKQLDVHGVTLWKAPGEQNTPEGKLQARRLWQQVRDDNIKNKPDGVKVVPVGRPQFEESNKWVNPARIKSRVYAASTYGAPGDKWARDPNNWVLNKDGSATLREDPSGLAHALIPGKNGVITGWNKVDRVDGYDAIAFLASHLPNGVYVQGGTVYRAREGERVPLAAQLEKQTIEREAKEQPGVLVLWYFN